MPFQFDSKKDISLALAALFTLFFASAWLLISHASSDNRRSALIKVEKAGGNWRETNEGIRIDLSGVKTSDFSLSDLNSIPKICSLNISRTNYCGNHLSEVRCQPSLVSFVASNSPRFKDLKELSKVGPNLSSITLYSSSIDDKSIRGLAAFKMLRNANLAYTRLSDESAELIGSLNSLRSLDIQGSQITDKFFNNMRDNSKLQSLRVGSTSVTSDCLSGIRKLSSLREIGLADTGITDQELELLCELSVEKLNLALCDVTDAGVRKLRKLQTLRSLDLTGTNVSKTCLEYLADIEDLAELHVGKTRISQSDIVSSELSDRLMSITLENKNKVSDKNKVSSTVD